MSNFQDRPYLRVLTPRTIDGVNPVYDGNMRPKYKESHFELSAKKDLEKENLKLPPHLRHIIKVVGNVPTVEPGVQLNDIPFTPRPQRVPRVNPQPEDLEMPLTGQAQTQAVNTLPTTSVVKQQEVKEEKPKRHRRTRAEIKAEKGETV
jgi:hypothetical protein